MPPSSSHIQKRRGLLGGEIVIRAQNPQGEKPISPPFSLPAPTVPVRKCDKSLSVSSAGTRQSRVSSMAPMLARMVLISAQLLSLIKPATIASPWGEPAEEALGKADFGRVLTNGQVADTLHEIVSSIVDNALIT